MTIKKIILANFFFIFFLGGCSNKWTYADKNKLLFRLKNELTADVHISHLLDMDYVDCLSKTIDKKILYSPNLLNEVLLAPDVKNSYSLKECYKEANNRYILNYCAEIISENIDITVESAKCFCYIEMKNKSDISFHNWIYNFNKEYSHIDKSHIIKKIDNNANECIH